MTIRSLLLLIADDYWIHIEAQTQTSHDKLFTCERRSRGGSRYLPVMQDLRDFEIGITAQSTFWACFPTIP